MVNRIQQIQGRCKNRMLSFSRQQIEFKYSNDSHLTTAITITNTSQAHIYYKFKVNRPRYYLMKPDRGVIEPNLSVTVTIKLHKEGISQANADKFKCFYIKCNPKDTDREMEKFQERPQVEHKKLLVFVESLPANLQSFKLATPVASSEVRSLQNSNMMGGQRGTTQYESLIEDKRNRVTLLTNEIERIEREIKTNKNSPSSGTRNGKKGNSLKAVMITGLIGLVLGFVSSAWI